MTKISLSELKKQYQEALKTGKKPEDTFTFKPKEGGEHEFVISYAKYLIIYLEGVYKDKGVKENRAITELKQG
jgi:hypothetical protein